VSKIDVPRLPIAGVALTGVGSVQTIPRSNGDYQQFDIKIRQFYIGKLEFDIVGYWPENSKRFINVSRLLAVNSIIWIAGRMEIHNTSGVFVTRKVLIVACMLTLALSF